MSSFDCCHDRYAAQLLPGTLLDAFTYVALWVEIAVPLLVLTALRPCLQFVAIMTIATQIGIAAAGNYNFFNFLTVALTLLLLDDDAIRSLAFWRRRHVARILPRESKVVRAGAAVMQIASFGTILASLALLPVCVRVTATGSLNEWSSWLLSLPLIGHWAAFEYRLALAFDVAAFQSLVVAAVPFMMAWLGVLLVWHTMTALISASCDDSSRCISVSRAFAVLNVALLSTCAVALFCIGCVPFLNGIDARNGTLVSRFVPDLVQRAYTRVQPLSIVNAYGLFRVMTTDRLELVVQGSRDGADDSWRDYELPFQVQLSDESIVPAPTIPNTAHTTSLFCFEYQQHFSYPCVMKHESPIFSTPVIFALITYLSDRRSPSAARPVARAADRRAAPAAPRLANVVCLAGQLPAAAVARASRHQVAARRTRRDGRADCTQSVR